MRLIDGTELINAMAKEPVMQENPSALVELVAHINNMACVEWHYPSKGEYPTSGENVLVAFQEGGLWYFANAEYHEGGWASVVDLGNIVAWQNIIPPKEEV